MIVRHTRCRLCAGDLGDAPVLRLKPTPIANGYETTPALGARAAFERAAGAFPLPMDFTPPVYPLDLYLCSHCNHLQLGHVIDAQTLFGNYAYVSPPGMRPHWKTHAEECIARFGLKAGDLVVEIGSNGGDLLREYQRRGMRVLGFEPAKEIAQAAERSGIPTACKFFDAEAGEWGIGYVRGRYTGPSNDPRDWPLLRAKLVLAANVFAHIDDLDSVVQGIKSLLAEDGIFVFEVQYLLDLVEQGLWDMVYHEHLSYWHVDPMRAFFRRHGLELFDVQRIATHGGSIRCFVKRRNAIVRADGIDVIFDAPAAGRIATCVAVEHHDGGLYLTSTYATLQLKIDETARDVRTFFDNARTRALNLGDPEPTIAGYGAPAKATTLLWQIGLDAVPLSYVVDDEPRKQGKFLPGTAIPIVSSGQLLESRPDYLFILAWNFSQPIVDKVKAMYLEAGRKPPRFVVPLPEFRVVT